MVERGLKFGQWRTTGQMERVRSKSGKPYIKWEVVCECGEKKLVYKDHLLKGKSKGCKAYSRHSINKRFGRLLITDVYRKEVKGRFEMTAKALCDCGKTTELRASSVINGHTKSCGCANDLSGLEKGREAIHGFAGHYLYSTWSNMKDRCYNQNAEKFHRYGARGIQVCEEWKNDPKAFIEWILENLGERPEGYSLDRINNNGNYEPKNVRWADAMTQVNNRG